MKEIRNKLLMVLGFSIAMGFLEAAVVVYLRELYYPNGFQFPLQKMPIWLIQVEIWREAATIAMLSFVACLASTYKWQRWGYFLIAFAVWDIIYYVGLKLWLNWPESLFTWDVLFLIPITWVGPVIAPIVIAVIMMVLGTYLILGNQQGKLPLAKVEIAQLVLGSLICIVSFILDYATQWMTQIQELSFSQFVALSESYLPQSFNWWLYGLGVVIIALGTVSYMRATHAQLKHQRYEVE